MMFKEMNPEDVWKELDGHKNVVAEEMKQLTEYFSKLLLIPELYSKRTGSFLTTSPNVTTAARSLPPIHESK